MMYSRLVVEPQAQYELPAIQHIGRLARKGVLWSGLLTAGKLVLSFLVTAILARLLSPQDYGLVGMVATLTALIIVFSDMGLSWATVQRKDLSVQQIHNLFWINSAVGIILWGVCAGLAPLLARFYGEPALMPIAISMSASFAVGGFAVQPLALLNRQMRFKRLAVVQIGSAAIGGSIAITLAVSGWGYWALVWQVLATSLALLILAIVTSGYRPARPMADTGTRSLLEFGGLLAANGILIYVARNMDNVLIGRVWGAADLGYYTRAYFLMTLPSLLVTGTLASVMIPALAALWPDRDRFGDAYRQALHISALIGCPLAAGLGLVAPEAIRLMYGPRWEQVVPILTWLSVSAVVQPIFNTQGWLFTATGKGRAYLIATVIYAVLTTGSFVAGIQYGAVGVARSYSIVFVVLVAFPILYLAHRAAELDFRRSLRALAPVAAATTGMIAAVLFLGVALRGDSLDWFTALCVKVLVAAVTYGMILYASDHRTRLYVRTMGAQVWSR